MTEPKYAYRAKPIIPRLHHCAIGSRIKLAHDSKERVIVHKCAHYAYFDNYQASLCCRVVEAYMKFTTEGWQCKPTQSNAQ